MNGRAPDWQPSPEWNADERLTVIGRLAHEMMAANGTGPQSSEFNFKYAERIELLSAKPAKFLENNRQKVLEGQP